MYNIFLFNNNPRLRFFVKQVENLASKFTSLYTLNGKVVNKCIIYRVRNVNPVI